MGTEIFAAVGAAFFTLLLVLLFSLGAVGKLGLPAILGNRENMPELTGWLGRARRAHVNALENLAPFAIVAVAVQLAEASSHASQVAAVTFLGARIVHGLAYLAGIPGVRTLAWNVGVAATFVTAFPLLHHLPL